MAFAARDSYVPSASQMASLLPSSTYASYRWSFVQVARLAFEFPTFAQNPKRENYLPLRGRDRNLKK
jgi:hypothetical protein